VAKLTSSRPKAAPAALPRDVADRLFELAWEDPPSNRMAEAIALYVGGLEKARRLCRAWMPAPLEPGQMLPDRLPDGQPVPPATTPWPREWSPLPGVDLDVRDVLKLAWTAVMQQSEVPGHHWMNDFRPLLSHVRMPFKKLELLGQEWLAAGYPLECIRAACPRASRPGWLTPVEIDAFSATIHSDESPERNLKAWKILVTAGLDPADAWKRLSAWGPGTGELPNGQWLPDPPPGAFGASRIVAGLKLSGHALRYLFETLPHRPAQAIKFLCAEHKCGLLQARMVVEILTAEILTSDATPFPADAERTPARVKLDTAIDGVIIDRPFHWALLSLALIVEDPRVPTMAVGKTVAGKIALFYNPDFVLGMSRDECRGVLVHEINHVILEHLVPVPETRRKSAQGPHADDEIAWVLACEVTANEYVPYPLPGSPITIQSLKLAPFQSTLERFTILRKRTPRHAFVMDFILGTLAARPTDHADTVDAPMPDTDISLRAAATAVGDEIDKTTEKMIADRGVGAKPFAELLTPRERPELAWNVLLRTEVQSLLKRQATRTYPNRRQPLRIGIVPGRRSRRDQPTVLVAIDTSGSMSSSDLQRVSAEMQEILRLRAGVVVIQCDTEIRHEARLKKGDRVTRIWGRGGTSLCPPFDAKLLRKYRPDLVVYFTDGYGEAPESPPVNAQVLWVLTGHNPRVPARWGRSVCMKPENERHNLVLPP
jgi:predicted metal-dependent peptidase